jgi:hypothetical protein
MVPGYTGSVYGTPKAYLDQFQVPIFKFLWPRARYEPIAWAVQLLPFLSGSLAVVNSRLKLSALVIKHLTV